MPTLDLATLVDGSPVQGIQTNRAFAKVHKITDTTGNPTEYVITNKTAIAVNDVSASLQASASCFVEAGTMIYFGSDFITVSADTTISGTSPTSVPIYAATAAITDETASHPIFGMVKVPVAAINNWNQTVNYVDAKLLGYGEQDQQERSNVTWDLGLDLIVPPDNKAYYAHILPSADNHAGYTGRCQLFVGMPSNNAGDFEYAVGPAQISISSASAPKNEIIRATVSAKFQYPYLKSTDYANESVSRKALLVTAAKMAGVAIPT